MYLLFYVSFLPLTVCLYYPELPYHLTIPFLPNFLVHCFILDPANKYFKPLSWSPKLTVLLTFCHSHLINLQLGVIPIIYLIM